MDEIVNRVKESGLISMDLADFKPKIKLVGIDIADALWERIVLKEKDFRQWIKEHDWNQYEEFAVFIYCSEDAIIPTWAYMLIASKLEELNVTYVVGSKLDLEKYLISENINSLKLDPFKDGRVIIKGCSDIASPEYAMTQLIHHLQPVVKSIMYGEPCSTVPVFKRK